MPFPNLRNADICKLGKGIIKHANRRFFRKKCTFAWIVKGLRLKQIVWNFVQYLKTLQIVHLLTQNMIKAFKFRAQAIINFLKKTSPLVHKIWVQEIFSLFYIISTEISYIHKKLDTNSWLAKLRANSYLFSFI
jgi:RNA recognition motif-containing protein